jgi:hypothetical protein
VEAPQNKKDMEELKIIYPELERLKEYFWDIQLHFKDGKMIQERWISEDKYELVSELLEEFGINDQQIIDNICQIVVLMSNVNKVSHEREGEEMYYDNSDEERFFFTKWLKNHKVNGIVFETENPEGNHLKPLSHRITDEIIINEIINKLHLTNSHVFSLKMKENNRGRKITYPNHLRKVYKNFYFKRYFSVCTWMNDLSKRDQEYFKGSLFLFAGMIEAGDGKKYKGKRDMIIRRYNRI